MDLMLNTILVGLLKVVGIVLLSAWAVGLVVCLVAVVIMAESTLREDE